VLAVADAKGHITLYALSESTVSEIPVGCGVVSRQVASRWCWTAEEAHWDGLMLMMDRDSLGYFRVSP
jgi:hypothetical protein